MEVWDLCSVSSVLLRVVLHFQCPASYGELWMVLASSDQFTFRQINPIFIVYLNRRVDFRLNPGS